MTRTSSKGNGTPRHTSVFNAASVGQYGPDPDRVRTWSGQRQQSVAIAAEQRLKPRQDAIAREVDVMNRGGMHVGVKRVMHARNALGLALRHHGSLLDVTRNAAKGCVGHRDRTQKLVKAQEVHLHGAGSRVEDRARAMIECVHAFNTLQSRWAEDAPVFYRKIEFAELENATKSGKFRRKPDSQYRFTGFSMSESSPFHTHRPITLEVGQGALLYRPYPVMYTLFEVRSGNDIEEIDSPKSARLIQECEVRIPDGALVNLAEVKVIAYTRRMAPDDMVTLNGKNSMLKALEPR